MGWMRRFVNLAAAHRAPDAPGAPCSSPANPAPARPFRLTRGAGVVLVAADRGAVKRGEEFVECGACREQRIGSLECRPNLGSAGAGGRGARSGHYKVLRSLEENPRAYNVPMARERVGSERCGRPQGGARPVRSENKSGRARPMTQVATDEQRRPGHVHTPAHKPVGSRWIACGALVDVRALAPALSFQAGAAASAHPRPCRHRGCADPRLAAPRGSRSSDRARRTCARSRGTSAG